MTGIDPNHFVQSQDDRADSPDSEHSIADACDLDATMLRRAAQSQCTILVTGETGAGKGHLARWLHQHSLRRLKPFIPVNCGAIPDGIVDSQLFGHARGAFSGATTQHMGLVRAADNGTLLLDEVGELPATAQLRLLRLLQEGEVQPVGESKPIIVNVRIIAATNVDLQQRVTDGRFREDLLYRLDVIRVAVRPLRERRHELPALIDTFNQLNAETYRQAPLTFDDEARSLLLRCPWHGNVRQLRTVIERLHVFCPGQRITAELVRRFGQIDADACHPQDELRRSRSDTVRRVLAESDGSISRAAEVFGVHRSTLYRWMRDA